MPANWNNTNSKPSYSRRGCPICNKPTEGLVRVIGQKFAETKPGSPGKSIGSISRSLCQQHTIELYNDLERAFEYSFEKLFYEHAERIKEEP